MSQPEIEHQSSNREPITSLSYTASAHSIAGRLNKVGQDWQGRNKNRIFERPTSRRDARLTILRCKKIIVAKSKEVKTGLIQDKSIRRTFLEDI
jgi:hypothetical protein